MTNLANIEDLFYDQLADIYSAETQMIKALPKMVKKAFNNDLKAVFSKYLVKTKLHKKRLENIAEECAVDISSETCQALRALLRKVKFYNSKGAARVMQDARIIAEARRIVQYKISIYETAIHFARTMCTDRNMDSLQQSLREEKNTERILVQIAESKVNKQSNKILNQ